MSEAVTTAGNSAATKLKVAALIAAGGALAVAAWHWFKERVRTVDIDSVPDSIDPVSLFPFAVRARRNSWETAETGSGGRTDRPFIILSLDGGGVRGVYSAVILKRLEEIYPNILREVNLIAGASTGGLIALLLGAGYTPQQIQDLYEEGCPYIFSSTSQRRYSIFNARYDDANKKTLMDYYMKDLKLGDLQYYVLVTAFRISPGSSGDAGKLTFFPSDQWRPALFSNMPLASGRVHPDNDELAVDVAMRTSAAPTYFPIYQGYVDGAIYANNPAMSAVAKVCDHYKMVTINNIVVVSVGSGKGKYSINVGSSDTDWGIRQWAPHLVALLMESTEISSSNHLQLLLGDRYLRIDVELPHEMELDDVGALPSLIEMGFEMDLSFALPFLDRYFQRAGEESD